MHTFSRLRNYQRLDALSQLRGHSSQPGFHRAPERAEGFLAFGRCSSHLQELRPGRKIEGKIHLQAI